MIRGLWLAVMCCATFAGAQEEASRGTGALLRGLDKINGATTDFEVGNGGRVDFGRLQVELLECRYPAGNPAGDAFAFMTIRNEGQSDPIFSGWMTASSPALNALDHPRYDVWVLRCKTS